MALQTHDQDRGNRDESEKQGGHGQARHEEIVAVLVVIGEHLVPGPGNRGDQRIAVHRLVGHDAGTAVSGIRFLVGSGRTRLRPRDQPGTVAGFDEPHFGARTPGAISAVDAKQLDTAESAQVDFIEVFGETHRRDRNHHPTGIGSIGMIEAPA